MAERWHPGWGLALLRATLGIIFLVHGWDKLLGEEGVRGFTALLVAEGFPLPNLLARAIAALETLGGLLLLVGWFTRWAAAALAVEILVALFAVHAENGFFVFRPFGEWGYEYNLLLLGSLGCLFLAGGGTLSVDDWFVPRSPRPGG